MRNILISIILMSLSQPRIFGQNLVPNPSFEIYTTCPFADDQVKFAQGWKSFGYSPDYFNVCATNPWFQVPQNVLTFQYAATGDAYCGLWTYDSANVNLREFIGTQLISDLIIGNTYYISFKINSTLDTSFDSGSNTANDKLGIKFSTVAYDSINLPAINNFAQLYSTTIISDTLNWTKITGSFVADSAYKYIIIGNFFDDSQTNIITYFDNGVYPVGYYFIDDIYVSSTPDGILNTFFDDTQINVYPNPCFDRFVLTIPNFEDVFSFSLQSVLGNIIMTSYDIFENNTIFLPHTSDNLFFLIVNYHNKSVVKKITKYKNQ